MEPTAKNIAALIDRQIDASGKSATAISNECGFQRPNVLSMIRHGKTPVPLARADTIARALNLDPRAFVELVFRTYQPEQWDVLSRTFSIGQGCPES